MSAQMPTLLAVLGTVLTAIVIFAPSRAAPMPAVSFAPPLPAPPSRDRRPHGEDRDDLTDGASPAQPAAAAPAWPAYVDARAAGSDASTRLALVEALATVGGSWATAILRRALDDETDAAVSAAVREALVSERFAP